ncbi:MAG: superoxide dismutase family protein [Actinomycetota bacterium]|nr:superoxide dismutase family protein [Actinomycetota bacterium]
MKRILLLLVMVVIALLTVSFVGGIAGAQGTSATAQLVDSSGNPVGTAEFVEGPNGLTVTVNLQPGQRAVTPGEHGIHIHRVGSITPDFEAAGEHFNPTSAQHGFNNPQGPHGGDLQNITVNEDGSASYQTTAPLVTLSRGDNALLDSDGSALVIHQNADDYQTDPSGESGDRVAAGVIRASATGETTAPLPSSGGPAVVGSVLLPAAALLVGSGVLVYGMLRGRGTRRM